MKKVKTIKVSEREKLLSYLSWLVGGWNASPGVHAGHLRSEPDYKDDEKILRLILLNHESDVTHNLRDENKTLKAKLYDLTNKS